MTSVRKKTSSEMFRTPRWLRGTPRSLRSIMNPEELSIYRRMRNRDLFRRAVERAELGVAGVTSYALRHSSIVRALLGGVPVAVAAQLHDTSVREIEAHYAAFILDHSDALTRRTLLDTAAPVIAERGPTLRGVGT
jgi:integrase